MRIIVTYQNRVGLQTLTFNTVEAASNWTQRLQRNGIMFRITYTDL